MHTQPRGIGTMSESGLTPSQLKKARRAIEVLSSLTDSATVTDDEVDDSSASSSTDRRTQEGELWVYGHGTVCMLLLCDAFDSFESC